jgi:hypothetical protein
MKTRVLWDNDSILSLSIGSPLYRRRSRGICDTQVYRVREGFWPIPQDYNSIFPNTTLTFLNAILGFRTSYFSRHGPSVNPGYHLRQANWGCLCQWSKSTKPDGSAQYTISVSSPCKKVVFTSSRWIDHDLDVAMRTIRRLFHWHFRGTLTTKYCIISTKL